MPHKTIIIAEAGVNHNGSIELAKKLIEAAAAAGADYVKFQTFKAERLVSKAALKAEYQIKNTGTTDQEQLSMLKRLELRYEDHYLLIAYAKNRGIKFLSSPFDEESLQFLMSLGVDFVKIPSGEITNLPYLRYAASFKMPVIISSGMADLKEIGDAIAVFEKNNFPKDLLTILHCNTEYPTPFRDVNLLAMQSIRDAYGVKVGYSDHTLGIEVPIAAVAMGAEVIEKHFTLDTSMEGPDHKASLDPGQLKQMVSAIRNIEQALGNKDKKPSASEQKNIIIARKSIHLGKEIKKGETITSEHLIMKRPGDGISPMRYDEIIGRKVNKDYFPDDKLDFEDIE